MKARSAALLLAGATAIAWPLAAQDTLVQADSGSGTGYSFPRIPTIPSTPFGVPVRAEITITGVAPASCAPPSAVVTFTGRGFGASQGDRRVSLNDLPPIALTVKTWSDKRIVAALPASVRPGVNYGVGLRDREGNWISNVNRRVAVCR
jgi:hypothetical protein